jgi:Na+/H+-dicarboxylate symporter
MAISRTATSPVANLPAGQTFAALAAGLLLGWGLAGTSAIEPVLSVAGPVGTVWLRALQMTIIPLVASLLVTGVVQMVATARAGPMARRTLVTFTVLLAAGGVFSALAMPPLLDLFPIPDGAAAALVTTDARPQPVPGMGAFFESLVAPNIVAAAAETAMLPVIVFFAALAVAITRLPADQAALMTGFFTALGHAMLVVIGWVLRLAPVGVFALAIGVAAASGSSAFAALGHYILLVSGIGVVVLLLAYPVGIIGGRLRPLAFARAVIPAQTVGLTTQSSLASLPAMLASCGRLGLREGTADFVLPLAVALFRVTGPAMNLAVAIYVAKLTGVELTPGVLLAGFAAAMVTTVGAVSLPGAISFVTSIGPIALAMGVPVEPLALLVAVEMLPDIVRTVGNVTMDVAVTATMDQDRAENSPGQAD